MTDNNPSAQNHRQTPAAIATAIALAATAASLPGCGAASLINHSQAAILGSISGSPGVTHANHAAAEDPEPAADFPATLAVARVQAPNRQLFRRQSAPPAEALRLASNPEIEQHANIERITQAPAIARVVPVRASLAGRPIADLDDLAAAARTLDADLLLVYTFDTDTRRNTTIPVVGVATLGLFPNVQQIATARVSAVILDTRTGFRYHAFEAFDDAKPAANAWTADEARGDAVIIAEQRALDTLIENATTFFENIDTTVLGNSAP